MIIHTDEDEVRSINKALKAGNKYKSNSNVEHFYMKSKKFGLKKFQSIHDIGGVSESENKDCASPGSEL